MCGAVPPNPYMLGVMHMVYENERCVKEGRREGRKE